MGALDPVIAFLKYFQRFTFVHVCFAISFFASGLILSTFEGILFYSLRYVSKYWYRKINYYLLYSFYCQLVFMSEWWAGSRILIYIDKDEYDNVYGKEHGFLLMNHSYEVDWLCGWQFCDSIGVLGNCKAFAKKSIQYMPPIGWAWKFGEYIFLNRSFEKDREIIKQQIQELGDYPDPIWLLLFAEGTRLTPKKLEASQTFAKEKGLPVLRHHLTPRTKGFCASLQGMRGKIKALYDIQIAFKKDAKVPPTMTSLLYGKPVECHLYIQRISIDTIPVDEEEAGKWLFDHYELKDQMQESFHKTGDFFKESGVKPIPPRLLIRRVWPIINTVFWNVVILIPMFYFILASLLAGNFFYFSIGASILGLFYFVMKFLIGMSEISKSSSYGTSKKEK